jgi:MFS family permease
VTPMPAVSHYAAGAVLVRLTDEGARLALVLLALDRVDSARVGGALVAALLVPQVVAAPGIGLITDRTGAPQLVLAAAAIGFAVALAVTALGLGRAPLALVLAVLVAGGCCGPALTGGLTSQLSGVVGHDFLPRAFGLDALTYNVSGIVGPALVAVISGFASPAAALVALAAIAAIGSVVIAVLPLAGRPLADRGDTQPQKAEALQLLLRDRVLGLVTAATTLGHAGLGALPVVVVVLAHRAHVPSASGWLLTTFALGALFGSISWIARPATPRQTPAIVMATLVLTGLPLALAAGSTSLGWTGALFGVSGFFTGPLTGALFTTRQEHSPDSARAQVFTLGAGLKITAAAVGVTAAGALAQAPTVTQLLLIAACPLLAGAVGALLLCVGRTVGRTVGHTVRHTGGHAPSEPPSSGGVRDDRRRRDGSWRRAARVGQRR